MFDFTALAYLLFLKKIQKWPCQHDSFLPVGQTRTKFDKLFDKRYNDTRYSKLEQHFPSSGLLPFTQAGLNKFTVGRSDRLVFANNN